MAARRPTSTRRAGAGRGSESRGFYLLGSADDFSEKSFEYKLVRYMTNRGLCPVDQLVHVLGGTMVAKKVAGARLAKRMEGALLVLKNPLHRRNRWKALAERVVISNVVYYRLVREIPIAVKEEWDRTGKPPVLDVTWGVPPKDADSVAQEPLPPQERPAPRRHSAAQARVIEMAADWVAWGELADRIVNDLCDGDEGRAVALWNSVANLSSSNQATEREDREINGVQQVRLVRTGRE